MINSFVCVLIIPMCIAFIANMIATSGSIIAKETTNETAKPASAILRSQLNRTSTLSLETLPLTIANFTDINATPVGPVHLKLQQPIASKTTINRKTNTISLMVTTLPSTNATAITPQVIHQLGKEEDRREDNYNNDTYFLRNTLLVGNESYNESDHNLVISFNATNVTDPHEKTHLNQRFIVITLLSLFLGTLILATILGNLFVITAVITENMLKNVGNYLVLSLAVTDLLVACLVMPLGALNEVMQEWTFGAFLCELWTTMDVLCCTASILHLLAIAFDRYLAVTNIDYVHQRNARHIGCMVLLVWIVAGVISVAPILGWKDDEFLFRIEHEKRCLVSQNVSYQIFATMFSFYGPSTVVLILYYRIFLEAKKRIRRKRVIQDSRSKQKQQKKQEQQVKKQQKNKNNNKVKLKNCAPNDTPDDVTMPINVQHQQCTSSTIISPSSTEMTTLTNTITPSSSLDMPSNSPYNSLQKSSSHIISFTNAITNITNTNTNTQTSAAYTTCTSPSSVTNDPYVIYAPSTSENKELSSSDKENTDITSTLTETTDKKTRKEQEKERDKDSEKERRMDTLDTGDKTMKTTHHNNHIGVSVVEEDTHSSTSGSHKKSMSDIKRELENKRERKAAKTLAIITGIFIACWLPFFVVALIMPLCENSCGIHPYVFSFCLWLGWANSSVNPFLYTIFSPDFRNAFRKMLRRRNR